MKPELLEKRLDADSQAAPTSTAEPLQFSHSERQGPALSTLAGNNILLSAVHSGTTDMCAEMPLQDRIDCRVACAQRCYIGLQSPQAGRQKANAGNGADNIAEGTAKERS